MCMQSIEVCCTCKETSVPFRGSKRLKARYQSLSCKIIKYIFSIWDLHDGIFLIGIEYQEG
jgi:hypothetical protein